jgi:hypothetical protein
VYELPLVPNNTAVKHFHTAVQQTDKQTARCTFKEPLNAVQCSTMQYNAVQQHADILGNFYAGPDSSADHKAMYNVCLNLEHVTNIMQHNVHSYDYALHTNINALSMTNSLNLNHKTDFFDFV